MTVTQRLASLSDRGFDQAYAIGRDELGRFTRAIRPKCSQCEVLVINGTACHETGCPNMIHECRGCNATVARAGAYCEDCC